MCNVGGNPTPVDTDAAIRGLGQERAELLREIDGPRATVIRCHACQSTLIFKRVSDTEIEVYHSCPKAISEGAATAWETAASFETSAMHAQEYRDRAAAHRRAIRTSEVPRDK